MMSAELYRSYRWMRSGPTMSFSSETAPSGTIWPASIARLEAGHLRGGGAERGIGLRHHVPGAAEIVEIVDIKPAEINLQRLENVGDGDVLLLGFDAVHVDVNLRDAGAEGGEQPAQARGDYAAASIRC